MPADGDLLSGRIDPLDVELAVAVSPDERIALGILDAVDDHVVEVDGDLAESDVEGSDVEGGFADQRVCLRGDREV